MDETKVLKRKIIKFLKEHGSAHIFFLAEKIGCPNNTRFYRRKVNKAVIALFEEGLIRVEEMSPIGPEESIVVSTIALRGES